MKTVYLALGSNLGDREKNLQAAVDRIAEVGVEVTSVSAAYETKPMYRTDQPMFLNMVIEGRTELFPKLLLKRLKAIERALGRRRDSANAPRVIDIDILFHGQVVMDTPELVIPHPRIAERRFVLEPLAEIAPLLRHPKSKKKIRDLLQRVADQDVRKVDFQVALKSDGPPQNS